MTRLTLRKTLTALAILAPIVVPSSGAQAGTASDVAAVAGTGRILPGLPTTGCAFQSQVTFGGTAVNAGDHAGVYDVTFTGSSDICETLNTGHGTGQLGGSGITGNVAYTRNGNAVQITGSGALNGVPHSILAGVCQFYPTAFNPVTDYALTCQVVLND